MEEEKKSEELEKKNEKYWKIILLVGIALILIVTIVIISVNKIKLVDKQIIEEKNAMQNQTEQGTTGGEEVSLIDMGNIENAKVEEGKKENTSEELLKEKEFNGFKVKDIKLYSNDGSTYFKAEVVNNSGKAYSAKTIVVKFLNKDGQEYSVLNTYIGDIAVGESGYINASTTEDLANAYNFSVNFN